MLGFGPAGIGFGFTGWHPGCSSVQGSAVHGVKDVAQMVPSNPVFHKLFQLWLFSLLPGGSGCSLWWTLQGIGITTGWL